MARVGQEGADKVYAVAERFRENALESDGSILTPDRDIWTTKSLDELHTRFTVNWDGGKDPFDVKLKRQLAGADDDAIQLMAETFLMHVLVTVSIGGSTKRETLNEILGWMKRPVALSAEVDAALDYGLAGTGMFFNRGRDRQIRFIIEAMRTWKALAPVTQSSSARDPWSFKDHLFSVDINSAWMQRSALLHLVFPGTFERSMSRDDKGQIVTAFAELIGGQQAAIQEDQDRALFSIREALSQEYGVDFDYYDTPEVFARWHGGAPMSEVPLLDRVLTAYPSWTGFADPRFVKDESNYKRTASENARSLLGAEALRGLIDEGRFSEIISRVEKVGQSTNLLWLQVPKDGDLSLLYRQGLDQAEFAEQLYDLLHGDGESPIRLGRFADYTTARGLPTKWALPTYLLMLLHPDTDFFVKPQATKWFLGEVDAGFELSSKASGEVYAMILDEVGALRQALAPYGPQSTVDVQGYIWVAYRTDPALAHPEPDSNEEGEAKMETSVYDHISEAGFHFPDWLVTDYVLSLATKPLVILSGISGTGKTKMAQLVSEHVAPEVMVPVARALPEPDEVSILHQAKRVLLEHFYVAIRTRQADLFPLPERGSGLDVELRAPGLAPMPGRLQNVGGERNDGLTLRLYLKGAARDWVRSEFRHGDYIRITPEGPDSSVIGVERIAVDTVDTPTASTRIAFLSVRPDWTDNRALLGYYNPLTQKYQSTELLRLLLRAQADPDEPHFVILDEMNLAKVEYYFSDFLSAVEADSDLVLHDAGDDLILEALDGMGVPQRLKVPANVFFTGTVNVDETTYMFSPKVLDRANTLEFNEVDLVQYGADAPAGAGGYRLSPEASVESLLAAYRRPRPQDWRELPAPYAERLRALHSLMAQHNLHFGYRVANEIARYLNLAAEFVGPEALETAYDLQVLQKVLPKLSGSRAKLEGPLTDLLEHLANEDLPLSAAKVGRMLKTVRSVGFVSFVE